MTEADIKRIEKNWQRRAKKMRYHNNIYKYLAAQTEYFSGVMDTLGESVPYWQACIVSGKKIIDEYGNY